MSAHFNRSPNTTPTSITSQGQSCRPATLGICEDAVLMYVLVHELQNTQEMGCILTSKLLMTHEALEQIKKALRNMFRRNKNQDGTRQKVQQSSPGVYQDHPATKPTTGESTWSGRPMKSTGNGQEDNAPAPPPKPTISQMVEARSDKHLAGAVSPVSEKELVTVATPSPKPAPPPTVLGGRMGGGGPINAVREKFSRLPSAPSTPVHSQQPVGAWDPVSSSSNAASNVAKNTPTTFQG